MKLTGLITIEKIRDAINSLYDDLPSIATQSEAEAGTDNTKMMTPLRTKELMEFSLPSIGFRRMNTAYNVGDKVNCAFKFELFLECTQAGTTSEETLDTRNATHGQVITDGTVQWTVRTHIKSVNGVVAGANGDVEIDVDVKARISITTGTIAHGGTIPVPDGYTRDQCYYAVWSHQMPDADKSYGGNSYHRTQVDQSTGVVFCQYNYDGNKLNGTAGYMCIAIKD